MTNFNIGLMLLFGVPVCAWGLYRGIDLGSGFVIITSFVGLAFNLVMSAVFLTVRRKMKAQAK